MSRLFIEFIKLQKHENRLTHSLTRFKKQKKLHIYDSLSWKMRDFSEKDGFEDFISYEKR